MSAMSRIACMVEEQAPAEGWRRKRYCQGVEAYLSSEDPDERLDKYLWMMVTGGYWSTQTQETMELMAVGHLDADREVTSWR